MLPFLLTILGFVVASLGQVFLSRRQNLDTAVLLLVAAVVLTTIAFRHLLEDGGRERQSLRHSWDRRGLLALLVASVPAWIGGSLLAIRWDRLFTGATLYALGLSLALLVCARREGWRLPRPRLKERWLELTLVGLVLAWGLLLRVYRLDYYPPPGGISWNDEAQIGKDAYGVLHHGYHPWQFPISVYTTALSFLALGPTVLALRLPFVLLGFLTLVVFYLLSRELFRLPVALAATFLFAVSRWHIAFSRLVLPSTPAMLLEVATFYLVLRGRRTGGMANYILAGSTVALGLYSHASFRIVPVLVGVLLAGEALSSWRAQKRPARQPVFPLRGLAAPWAAFLASAVVVTLPLFSIVLREPRLAFGERFTSVMPAVFEPAGAMQQDGLVERAQRLAGFFNYQGEAWGAVNLPDWPMLDPVTGVLFVLGFSYCLFYFWRNRHLFHLAWFLLTIIAGGLLTVELRSHRFVGVTPVLFIFAGVFLDGAVKTFGVGLERGRQRYLALFVVPMLAVAGWTNFHVFFHRQIHAASVRVEFTREVSDVANYIAALGQGHYILLFANYPYYSPGMDFAWMAGEAPGERGIDVLDVIPSHRHSGDEELVYIFVTPYDVEALAKVVQYFYPEARMETFHGEYGRYTFVAAHVRAAGARLAQGLLAHYSGSDLDDLPEIVRQESQVSVDWRAVNAPFPAPFSVQWRGTLYAPQDADYVLEMEPAELCQIYLDDLEVANTEPQRLIKGWHKLLVACPELEGRERLRFLWTAPGRPRELVPSEFLSPREEVNGVLVSVFEGPDGQGEPLEQSIEPVFSLLRMPSAWQSGFTPELAGKLYSLECRGQLEVEQPGSYGFDLRAWNGHATLWLDGAEVVTTEGAAARTGSGQVQLASGWHDLWLRYSYQGGEFSGVEVLWTPPGGETQTIPPALLRPEGQSVTGSASPAP